MILGISGKKRSGKDKLCNYLSAAFLDSKCFSYRRALADALKKEVAKKFSKDFGLTASSMLLEMQTDGKKEKYRSILQWYGTEYRRTLFGDDYWFAAMKQVEVDKKDFAPGSPQIMIVPDIRFTSEAEWVRSQGGYLIRVERPVLQSKDEHISEMELDDYGYFDQTFFNTGTLDNMRNWAGDFVSGFLQESAAR